MIHQIFFEQEQWMKRSIQIIRVFAVWFEIFKKTEKQIKKENSMIY